MVTVNFPEQNEPEIFPIGNYGTGLQLENNRSLGIAVMSLSIAIMGLILGAKEKPSLVHKQRPSDEQVRKK